MQPTQIHVTSLDASDPIGEGVRRSARSSLDIDTGRIRVSHVYTVVPGLPDSFFDSRTLAAFGDPLLHELGVGPLQPPAGCSSHITVDKLPGVTDDEGDTARTVLFDLAGDLVPNTAVHSRAVYWVQSELDGEALRCIAEELIGNPLVHRLSFGPISTYEPPRVPSPVSNDLRIETIDLAVDDATLRSLSAERLLSLDLREMQAIRSYFSDPDVARRRQSIGAPSSATDCELEILAQTWSEHCQHKEFNAEIDMVDHESDRRFLIDGLFRTYIRGATEEVAERLRTWGQDWLLKVFNDNAGVVRIDEERVFVWKVETHNSPSALDPYGGAITGILGNNRDPLGTGRGGGRLLFNTNVLCFGPPTYDRPLLPGQLHPRRILAGVRKGIEDGGNKSGVPTVNGAIVFDDRYAGKPLVFCGTGSIAPSTVEGTPWWEKPIDPGDRIVTVGGRVGKDGIHGATFSSETIDDASPRSAVQIGSPITQKLVSDFLEDTVPRGWIKCCTDNGAGGLSSSVGELARISGGADVQLDRVPLKYDGIQPWEIFVSESQERMTLVVSPERLNDVLRLAAECDVEATDIGSFTGDGHLIVRYGDQLAAYLDLRFLHEGTPRKHLEAVWSPPVLSEPRLPLDLDHTEVLFRLLENLNICSREPVIRQYDHEVKGRTIVKPLMGRRACGPQDAAVLRLGFSDYRGIAISNGILPRYGDIDPYEMSAGAFDEAVRGIVAVGGRLPDADGHRRAVPFWSVNDNFCVPNSAYDPDDNPTGKLQLAKLVRMCEALREIAVAYSIPLTSGKDSMKNDFRAGGVTISVPPTILYSMAAGMDDVRRSVTTDFKARGDAIFLVGETYDELGGSEFYRLLSELGAHVPRVRRDRALALYRCVAEATEHGWLASCHDLSDGGLAVALAESAIGGRLGARIHLDEMPTGLSDAACLYSESHSRFLVSVAAPHRTAFDRCLGNRATFLGHVSEEPRLVVERAETPLIDATLDRLESTWKSGLEAFV